MKEQPMLTESEWDLLRELLQRELDELPAEIHHTHSNDYRHRLQARRRTVENLLDRLQTTVTA